MLLLSSCQVYNMLDGRSKVVTFIPDSSLFDTLKNNDPSIYYNDLLSLRGQTRNGITFIPGEKATAVINGPTFFYAKDDFLVKAGDKIIVKADDYNDITFLSAKGNKRRNKELSFFKDFKKIQDYPSFTRNSNATLDEVFYMETKAKKNIKLSDILNNERFDSLLSNKRLSNKFKKRASVYLKNKYDKTLFFFYEYYKDTLQAHGIYKQKIEEFINVFNNASTLFEFDQNALVLTQVVREILPFDLLKFNEQHQFEVLFDTILSTYSAFSRDYLLSQLMYRAYKERIEVSSNYSNSFERNCYNKQYKNVLRNIVLQQQSLDSIAHEKGGNALVSLDNKKVSTVDEIIKNFRGKLVLVDFWASWCSPCLQENEYIKKLQSEFKQEPVSFVAISIDKDVQPWRKAVIAKGVNLDNNYLMIDWKNTKFRKTFQFETIPRYLLYDKDGNIISDNAPWPSDPLLKELLNKHLKEMRN